VNEDVLTDYGRLYYERWEALEMEKWGAEKRRSWLVFVAASYLKAEREFVPGHLIGMPGFVAASLETQRLTTLVEEEVAREETD
jgi:hypothetical protein